MVYEPPWNHHLKPVSTSFASFDQGVWYFRVLPALWQKACVEKMGLVGSMSCNNFQSLQPVANVGWSWLVAMSRVCVFSKPSCFLFWNDVGGEAKHIAQGSLWNYKTWQLESGDKHYLIWSLLILKNGDQVTEATHNDQSILVPHKVNDPSDILKQKPNTRLLFILHD